jgi:hypothetical protein
LKCGDFKPDNLYKLEIKYRFNSKNKSSTAIFLSPRPKKPYQSWIWNNGHWTAPKEVPFDFLNNKELYYWNEELLDWDLLGGYTVS